MNPGKQKRSAQYKITTSRSGIELTFHGSVTAKTKPREKWFHEECLGDHQPDDGEEKSFGDDRMLLDEITCKLTVGSELITIIFLITHQL